MKIKYYITSILIAISLIACESLEQLPQDTLNKSAVFNTENGLALYTNSFYNILPTSNNIIASDVLTDYSAVREVDNFIRPQAYTARESTGWTWTDLRNINYFIENCNSNLVAPEVKSHYVGLARFFRAWFYFEKVKRFGDVPWISKPLDVSDPALYNARTSRETVMDSVLADLDFACLNLRNNNDPTRSTINKYVAYAFKSRVCLFEGTFRKYHTQGSPSSKAESWLGKAAEAAEIVMRESGYSLHTAGGAESSYRQLFISDNPVSSEIMLARASSSNLGIFHWGTWWWTSGTFGQRLSLTRNFINTYLTDDGKPFTDRGNYQTMPFEQEVKNRDKRLQQTIRMGGYTRINGTAREAAPPSFTYTYTGYHPIKWSLDNTFYDNGTLSTNSISVIRFAEVLLNYAEAKAELGSLTDPDWKSTIGALRKRAGISTGLESVPSSVDPYMKKEYFPEIDNAALMEIRRERGIELVFEGFRFYDLVRWRKGELLEKNWTGIYVSKLDTPLDLNEDGTPDVCFFYEKPAATVPGVQYVNVNPLLSNGEVNPQQLTHGDHGEITWLQNIKRKWENKHYFYPVPENDRLMNPELGQNPGW